MDVRTHALRNHARTFHVGSLGSENRDRPWPLLSRLFGLEALARPWRIVAVEPAGCIQRMQRCLGSCWKTRPRTAWIGVRDTRGRIQEGKTHWRDAR
eukprot:11808469-Alexandrium_andersonii.AAC.1